MTKTWWIRNNIDESKGIEIGKETEKDSKDFW